MVILALRPFKLASASFTFLHVFCVVQALPPPRHSKVPRGFLRVSGSDSRSSRTTRFSLDDGSNQTAPSSDPVQPYYVHVLGAWRVGKGAEDGQLPMQGKDFTHALPGRILIVCLQHSGCNLFAKILAQIEGVAAFANIPIATPAEQFPMPEELDPNGAMYWVATTTIQGDWLVNPLERLRLIKARFRPDRSILVVRHPAVTIERLLQQEKFQSKSATNACKIDSIYINLTHDAQCGAAPSKHRALERLWKSRTNIFDAVVPYDAIVSQSGKHDEIVEVMQQMGVPLQASHFDMAKDNGAIMKYAGERVGNARFSWSLGNISDGPIRMQATQINLATMSGSSSEDRKAAKIACPTLFADFETIAPQLIAPRTVLDTSARAWFANRAGTTKTLALIFADYKSSRLLLNWLLVGQASRAFPGNHAIVCLDNLVTALVRSRGEYCFQATYNNEHLDDSLSAIWMLRIRMLSELLDEGLNVIMADTDAVWLHDPTPFLRDQTADIVASRGQCTGNHLCKQWGVSACMGFAFFRATLASQAVVASMLALSKASVVFDDQSLLNHVLIFAGVQFQSPTTTDAPVLEVGVARNLTLSLALLPHNLFPRDCKGLDMRSVVVAHCLSNTSQSQPAEGKRQTMESYGLWALKDVPQI